MSSTTLTRSGYTLIELLIVITLTAMLITFGVSAYRKAADIQAVKATTELILSTLTSAQKSATSGRATCSGPYYGETVTTNLNSSALTTTPTCQGGLGTPRIVNLPNNATFQTTNTLVFRPLSQGIDTGASDIQNLDFGTASVRYRIQVTRSGTIQALGRVTP